MADATTVKRRVLVVDDEEGVRESLRMTLKDDYETIAVGSAEEALDTLSSASVDVVLLDILMPGMDGWEALPLIRRVAPDTAVVMVSALGRRQDVAERATALGAAAYVDKAKLGSTPGLVASVCSDA